MDLTEEYVVWKISVETEEIALLTDLLINRRVKNMVGNNQNETEKKIEWNVVSKWNILSKLTAEAIGISIIPQNFLPS